MYDMIIGMDLMTKIGIYVDTEKKYIRWEGNTVPLKQRGQLQHRDNVDMLYSLYSGIPILQEAEKRDGK